MKRFGFAMRLGIAAVLIPFIFWLELRYMALEDVAFSTKLIIFIFMNLNLIALFVLMFFVGKSLLRLYLERKHKVLGYKFKTKFVSVLIIMTMIPSVFLFLVSSRVVTKYLDKWFDPQIRQPLLMSVDLAKSVYDLERQQALAYARAIAAGTGLPETHSVQHLASAPADASETVKAAFEGKAGAEVVTTANGDVIRAVAPVYENGSLRGIVMVESSLSRNISKDAEAIADTYQNYLTLESWKTPLKMNYLLILGFFTVLTIFMGLWVALRISRGITDPIQSLAQATEEVTRGNLDVRVSVEKDDEIGLLAQSFNKMVGELKEGKDSLQRSWTESERRRLIIEKIVGNINSGVIALDAHGTIMTLNSAACKTLGISPEEVTGKGYAVLLSILKSDELKEAVKNIRVREFRNLEREFRVTIGDRRVLLRVFITTLGDAGSFLGNLVVFDDLTDIVRAQKALAWEEVARRIAHEIKNPLTPIMLSTDRMIKKWRNQDEDFGPVFERSTQTIIKEVEGLKRLVNEFSKFGKMPDIHKAPVLVSSVVDSVRNLYRDYRSVSIGLTKEKDEPLVELDAEQFKRVVINIVDNAIQAMHNKGTINISISHDIEANRLYLDIADNGPGIREEDKERLFLPYFSTRKDGTGLGLAIASRVVTEHRGYIRIRDNKPTGSIFSIELPIKES